MTQKVHSPSFPKTAERPDAADRMAAQNHFDFFERLAQGTGRTVPAPTADAVQPILGGENKVASGSQLVHVCQRFGLTLSPIRPRIDEAIGLVMPQRPVLLELEGSDGPALAAIHDGDAMHVRIDLLSHSEALNYVVSNARAEERLAGWRLKAAHRVSSMGDVVSAKTTSNEALTAFQRLRQLLAPDRSEIIIVIGFAVGLGFLTLATPIAVQTLVNFVAFGGLMQPLIVVGILLLFFMAFAGAIRVFKFYVVEILQRRVFTRVVSDLSIRLPRVRFDTYDRGYSPELVNRFFDVVTVQKAGSTLMIDGLDILLQTGIGLLVLGFYHPLLLVFDILLIAVILFIVFGLGRGAVATARKESSAKYAVAGALEELTLDPMTYRFTGAPEFARARLADLAGDYILARRKHYSVIFRQLVGAVTLHAVAATALLTLGGFLVIRGQLTLGQLVAAELIVSVALASFVKFGKQFEATYDLLAGVDKLGILFDLPVEDEAGEPHVPGDDGARLELRRVSYRYPDSTSGLTGLSLLVEADERVAVRGPRGSGKSTVAELIVGLREPSEGVVLFDGNDIGDIARMSIRTQIDLVRGCELVDGSVMDNIRLGRSDISGEKIRRVLDRLGILDELLELQNGLRTEVSRSGAPLSRTMVLMLMLARAAVGAPRALVIDGVLDELDQASLSGALAVLCDRNAPWTLLVTTIRDAVSAEMERVIELDQPSAYQGERSP
ncbi:MAG: ATP-binding cassette domain-containing protein [Desulfobacterales bacterium]|nr:ATP-binding cassette domain-containing protein [Desulfobacterales bacterium]